MNAENTTERPSEDVQRPEQDETTPAPDQDANDRQQDEERPDAGDEAEGSELAKVRREAAGHRAKLRETEAERDAVTAERDALASTVLADALRGTGVTAKLLATAGRSIGDFITDGAVDRGAILAAAKDVRQEFGIANPARSPHTGTGGERPEGKPTWSDAVKNG